MPQRPQFSVAFAVREIPDLVAESLPTGFEAGHWSCSTLGCEVTRAEASQRWLRFETLQHPSGVWLPIRREQ